MTEIKCRYVEEEKLVAVEFTLWDGTTRHLVLPPTEQGKELAKWVLSKMQAPLSLKELSLQVPKGEVYFIGAEEDISKVKLLKSKLAVAEEALELIKEGYLNPDIPFRIAKKALAKIRREGK